MGSSEAVAVRGAFVEGTSVAEASAGGVKPVHADEGQELEANLVKIGT
jgi:hypothetical protein